MSADVCRSSIESLRARMPEDMPIRGFVEKTRLDHLRHLERRTGFPGRSPDTATAGDLRRFRPSQTEAGLGAPTVNGAVSALRFFFATTLDRPDLARRLTVMRQARKIPGVPSPLDRLEPLSGKRKKPGD